MKHTGSCHCQAVRYEVELDLSSSGAMACNCSMCQRKGTLLAFAPIKDFNLLSGSEKLSDYQFNKKHIHHLFCSNCGVTSFAKGTSPDGVEMAAINVRCLEGIDLKQLKIVEVDGRSF